MSRASNASNFCPSAPSALRFVHQRGHEVAVQHRPEGYPPWRCNKQHVRSSEGGYCNVLQMIADCRVKICKQLIRLPPSRRLQVHSLRTSNWRVSLREDLGSHHVFFFDELTVMFILMERGKDKNVRVAFHTLIRIFWSR